MAVDQRRLQQHLFDAMPIIVCRRRGERNAQDQAEQQNRRSPEDPAECLDRAHGSKKTSTGSTPAMVPRSVSPRRIGPTPDGVPVKIKSPGATSIYVESAAMMSATLHIMSLRSPLWRTLPSIASRIAP